MPVEHIDGGPVTWFVYTDHTTVPTVYAYDARTDAVTLHARPPGSVEPGEESRISRAREPPSHSTTTRPPSAKCTPAVP